MESTKVSSPPILEALVACAQAIDDKNIQVFDSQLTEVMELVRNEPNKHRKRMIDYFAEALVRRAYGIRPADAVSMTLELGTPPLFYNGGWYGLRNSAMRDAIMNNTVKGSQVHIIDFHIPHLYGSGYLFWDIPKIPGESLSVRVSVILPRCMKDAMNGSKEKNYLIKEAEERGFHMRSFSSFFASSLSELMSNKTLKFRKKSEKVIVFYTCKLQRLLAEEGALQKELYHLRKLEPDIVITTEQDVNLADENFIRRLKVSFEYYSSRFACDKLNKFNHYYRTQIYSILGCDQIVRLQTRVQWESNLRNGGFDQICLQTEGVNSVNFVLAVNSHPIGFVSAWKLNKNFAPLTDFNRIVENAKLQPLPVPQEGSSLQLAAMADIYDIAVHICCRHNLALSLTWFYGVDVEQSPEILSIEDGYWQALNWNYESLILGCLPKAYLSEKKSDIANFLQSNDQPFLLVPTFDAEYIGPKANALLGPLGVVSFCLQNYSNHVYVVDFFVSQQKKKEDLTRLSDLSSRICSELKAMGKRFVAVRVEGKLYVSNVTQQMTRTVEATNDHDKDDKVKEDARKLDEQNKEKKRKEERREKEVSQDCEGFSVEKGERGKEVPQACEGFSTEKGEHAEEVTKSDSLVIDSHIKATYLKAAMMIIQNQIPLNIVESGSFKDFVNHLQPASKLPSERDLRFTIINVYKEKNGILREYLDKLSSRFSLTASMWVDDLERITYCCYAIRFINESWEFNEKILAVKNLGDKFDSQVFDKSLTSVFKDWNLEKKVCSLTIHGSSSSFRMVDETLSFGTSFPTVYLNIDELNVGKPRGPCLMAVFDIYSKPGYDKEKGFPFIDVVSNDWKSQSLILAIAAMLDPRFKFQCVECAYMKFHGEAVARTHLSTILIAFTNIFIEYASHERSLNMIDMHDEESAVEFCNRYSASLKNDSKGTHLRELVNYLEAKVVPSNMEFDLLGWWKEQASSFPILERMSRDILAIPLSSAMSGSTFSGKAVMDNPNFKGLDLQTIEAMICSKDWLKSPEDCKSNSDSFYVLHKTLELLSSENYNKSPRNEDVGARTKIRTQEEVRRYLMSNFTEKEKECLDGWKNSKLEKCGTYGPFKILGSSLQSLRPAPEGSLIKDTRDYYVHDVVIYKFLILLKRRHEKFPLEYLKNDALDPLFTESYMNGAIPEPSDYAQIALKWITKGMSKLFIPMCVSSHWILFCADFDGKKMLWLDSMDQSDESRKTTKERFKKWFTDDLLPRMQLAKEGWSFVVLKKIPIQQNGWDCGVFLMKYAECLTLGGYDFPFTQDDIPHFRQQIFLDIIRGRIERDM